MNRFRQLPARLKCIYKDFSRVPLRSSLGRLLAESSRDLQTWSRQSKQTVAPDRRNKTRRPLNNEPASLPDLADMETKSRARPLFSLRVARSLSVASLLSLVARLAN